ncbi:hypothetical protein IAR50_005690 [Cryptococcus sp. DSM 104548]
MPTQFFIPDTSPVFAYSLASSSSSSSSSNSSASWVAAYSPRGDGYDQTFHLGTGDASVGINITASALSFSLSSSNSSLPCPAEYRINASSWAAACPSVDGDFVVQDLPTGLHQVEMRAVEGEGQLEVMGVGGELDSADGYSLNNLTIDDTSPSFVYSPPSSWTFASSSYSSISSNTTLSDSDLENLYNSTAHFTHSAGSKVELSFEGEALYVYGMALEGGGQGEVRLDGELQGVIDASGSWRSFSSLLYMGSGFSTGAHTLTIISTSTRPLIIDYALLSTQTSSSSSTNLGLIIGVILGVSALLILLAAGSYVFMVHRRSRNKPEYPFAGYGKNAAATYSNFTSLASKELDPWDQNDEAFLQKSRSTLALGTSGMRLGTTSVYSDYLPYRGPIEPPPSHLSEGPNVARTGSREELLPYGDMQSSHGSWTPSGMSTPPLISGASPSAVGWLKGARPWVASPVFSLGSASFSAGTGYTGSRSGSQRSASSGVGGRQSPLDRLDRHDFIGLDLYQPALSPPPFSSSRSSRPSPPRTASTSLTASSGLSTPSTLGLGLGEHVQQAVRMPAPARSVGRLWPTRDAVPSSYRTESVMQGASVGVEDPNPRALYSSSSLALNASTSVDALQSQIQTAPQPNTPISPLRRGASIKSIKTLRSFFSGIIFVPPTAPSMPHLSRTGGDGESEPQTPAVPWTAARPDSGIFPGLERGFSRRFASRRGRNKGGEKEGDGGDKMPASSVPAKSPVTAMVTRSPLSLARALPSDSRQQSGESAQTQVRDVEEGIALPHRPQGDAAGEAERQEVEEEEASPNFFIELDPNSPIEGSRPASQWTRYTRGSEGAYGRWEV